MRPRANAVEWDRFRPMASGSHRIDWWRTKEQEKSGRKRNETNDETPICPHGEWPLHGALAETGGLRGRGADFTTAVVEGLCLLLTHTFNVSALVVALVFATLIVVRVTVRAVSCQEEELEMTVGPS